MTECFRCGDDDHLSYDCPRHTREQPTPGPPAASGHADGDSKASKLPGYGTPVPPRIIRDPAIARRGAQLARELLTKHDDNQQETA